MDLNRLGWNADWEQKCAPFLEGEKDFEVGRVMAQYTHLYTVGTKDGVLTGTVSGKIRGGSRRPAWKAGRIPCGWRLGRHPRVS